MRKWTDVAVIALLGVLVFSIPSMVCAQQSTPPEIDLSDLKSYFFVGQQQLGQSTLRFKLRAKTNLTGGIYMYKYYPGGDWFDKESVSVSVNILGHGDVNCKESCYWSREQEGSVSVSLSGNPSRVRFVIEGPYGQGGPPQIR